MTQPPLDPTINPAPAPIPNAWYVQGSIQAWVGTPWREVELFRFMPRWPRDMDSGKRYVVFYKRNCDHCELMMANDLYAPLDAPITAVEIPVSRDVLTPPDAWYMPPYAHLELLSLPLGCDWLITPPLAMTFQDGVLTCVSEGDHTPCLNLQR